MYKASIATENFIKAIYKGEQGNSMDTKPGTIAKELGITNAAATDMARKLAMKKLIDYEKYKELKLTPDGTKVALDVLRKHRLWETFLHQVLGLTMHEIHREAELLEHLTSDFLAEKISDFLGNPETDPHGDPIPTDDGEIPETDHSITLSMGEPGNTYKISRLSGSDKEFFDFCHSNKLEIGTSLTVQKHYIKTRMIEIEIQHTKLLLNIDLTNTIYIKKAD
ncbi:metal-dependent transcriptional regulator [Mangrovibacterium lignilyticum]|uniref:metal-dependent transcriptional regulator n=1 Tax=Mangrovibacterium lignilyticum TaxID=2668052 RepID=UPI0013D3AA7D|nr:metal-dependent transcriptional regulator [Mangrovibacterium lignilyticum]